MTDGNDISPKDYVDKIDEIRAAAADKVDAIRAEAAREMRECERECRKDLRESDLKAAEQRHQATREALEKSEKATEEPRQSIIDLKNKVDAQGDKIALNTSRGTTLAGERTGIKADQDLVFRFLTMLGVAVSLLLSALAVFK